LAFQVVACAGGEGRKATPSAPITPAEPEPRLETITPEERRSADLVLITGETRHIVSRFQESLPWLPSIRRAAREGDRTAFERAADAFWARLNAAFQAVDDYGIKCF
jgi:hypothetical protein